MFYDTHPHWVVDCGCYAVTLRCYGSLPKAVQLQLLEMGARMRGIEPSSWEAKQYQRRQFAILERALDMATGFSPFGSADAAGAMMELLAGYDFDGLSFDHWVVMPNHVHLVTAPIEFRGVDEFRKAWNRFKSRSARASNRSIGRAGRFWQSSWYDRWIRGPEEYEKWLRYLARNPVRAGLGDRPEAYPYLNVAGRACGADDL